MSANEARPVILVSFRFIVRNEGKEIVQEIVNAIGKPNAMSTESDPEVAVIHIMYGSSYKEYDHVDDVNYIIISKWSEHESILNRALSTGYISIELHYILYLDKFKFPPFYFSPEFFEFLAKYQIRFRMLFALRDYKQVRSEWSLPE